MKIILSIREERFALTRKTFREFSINGERDTLNFRSLPRTAMRRFFSLTISQRQKGRFFKFMFTDASLDTSCKQEFFVFMDYNGQLHVGCKFFLANATNEIEAWALVERIPRA
jgi:hypothetical protein